MSHAEYAPRPIPVFSKLAGMLRNLSAVQFVVAKFANLLRSNKTGKATQISQFIGDAAVDCAPRVKDETTDFAELKAVDRAADAAPETIDEAQISQFAGGAAAADAPRVSDETTDFAELKAVVRAADAASETAGEAQVSQFVGDAAVDDTPRVSEQPAGFTELKAADAAPETIGEAQVSQFAGDAALDDAPRVNGEAVDFAEPAVSEAVAPEANEQSDRERLIRRRWAETGVKMWSGRSALNIQGRAGVLPARPGETLPRYDTLEYRLIAGQIVCEEVVVDPPQPRK